MSLLFSVDYVAVAPCFNILHKTMELRIWALRKSS